MTVWAKEYLGWNLKWIPGYKGTRSLLKALRQGEIDMMATASSKRINGLLKDGVIELVAQEGLGFGGNYTARAAYPDVPIFPAIRITSYNVCYTKLLRRIRWTSSGRSRIRARRSGRATSPR